MLSLSPHPVPVQPALLDDPCSCGHGHTCVWCLDRKLSGWDPTALPVLADDDEPEHEGGCPVGADAPGVPLLPFADWIELRASVLRLDDTKAARWLAGRLDELAAVARQLHAETPDEFDAREEVLDDDRAGQLRDEGWRAALHDAGPYCLS